MPFLWGYKMCRNPYKLQKKLSKEQLSHKLNFVWTPLHYIGTLGFMFVVIDMNCTRKIVVCNASLCIRPLSVIRQTVLLQCQVAQCAVIK